MPSMRKAAVMATALASLAGTSDAFTAPACVQFSRAWANAGAVVLPRHSPCTQRLRPLPLSLSASAAQDEEVAGPIGRKEKSKQKKAAKQEARLARQSVRKEVDAILDDLFDQIEAQKRDLSKMNELLDKIGQYKPEIIKPVLKGDWKLAFVDSAEAIHQVARHTMFSGVRFLRVVAPCLRVTVHRMCTSKIGWLGARQAARKFDPGPVCNLQPRQERGEDPGGRARGRALPERAQHALGHVGILR
jgi:hypothetical protein